MAGFFGASFIEQVRAASDIVEVIGSYFPLKRAGTSFVALCPFHREKSPSFHVSSGRQAFHCFGCHKGGDVFRFVQDYENVPFVDAVQRLAQRAGIPLQYESGGDAPAQEGKQRLRDLHDQIARRWQTALNEAQGQIARDYLARRGVGEEAVQLFRIGYAPDAWDDTVNWCKSKGFSTELALEAGLVVRKEETGRCYDRFRGRLMFPICDEQGRVIAFSGRILQGDEKTAKYVNSPETPIFTKGKVFYGLDKSKRPILDAGFAIICEGQLDLIACFQAGVKNVVAPQGTAFTPEHARILKRHAEEVVLCFDADDAGQKAAARVLDSLLGAGLSVRVAVLPAPHDPDTFIKTSGGEAFAKLVKEAPGFFDFYLDRLCRVNDPASDRGRLAILKDMGTAVHKAGNLVLTDTYVQKTAVRLGVATEAVRQEFRKLSSGPTAPHPSSEPPLGEPEEGEIQGAEEVPVARPGSHELWLLKLILGSEEVLPLAATHLDPDWIAHGLVRQILIDRLTVGEDGNYPTVAMLLGRCPDEATRRLIGESSVGGRSIPQPEQTLLDVITRLRNQWLERRMDALRVRLQDDSVSDADRMEAMREREVLRRLKLEKIG